ncbi:MAG: glutathione S-transferase family protein [Hyphomicrobiales bacterium]|nr:MAG: glutathione S-transferase family protein [Hyphomicrobiales bacterium]
MLKILGRLSSVNVQKVVWAAGETGQAFERIDIGGPFGGNREPAYLAKNPNGQVPVLEDGDVHIWESNAIVRYIAARYGRDMIWEEDPARRSEGDRWMDWALGELQRVMVPAFWGLMREPATADPAAIASSISRTEQCLDILEAHLENGFSYVGGDRFGMAEIVLGPSVHRWLNMPVARAPRPRLQRWYERIAAREAAQAALPLPIA